ncbi:MAG: AAA family ATPase [Lewinellaceae bacterium]|nr:AAA family ATPase [Lewinellaceae bacterium]
MDEHYTFEIGGKQKTHEQIAGMPNSFVIRDEQEFPVGKSLPLWLFGFLY